MRVKYKMQVICITQNTKYFN